MQFGWVMISLVLEADPDEEYCLVNDTARAHLSEHRDCKSNVSNYFAGTKFAPLLRATRHPPETTLVGPDHVREFR